MWRGVGWAARGVVNPDATQDLSLHQEQPTSAVLRPSWPPLLTAIPPRFGSPPDLAPWQLGILARHMLLGPLFTQLRSRRTSCLCTRCRTVAPRTPIWVNTGPIGTAGRDNSGFGSPKIPSLATGSHLERGAILTEGRLRGSVNSGAMQGLFVAPGLVLRPGWPHLSATAPSRHMHSYCSDPSDKRSSDSSLRLCGRGCETLRCYTGPTLVLYWYYIGA